MATEEKYLKTNTLFEREDGKKGIIIPEKYACEEFGTVNRWLITEKLHGENTRIIYEPETKRLYVNGKTDDAKPHEKILGFAKNEITVEKLEKKFPFNPKKPTHKVVLYGEAIGKGILDYGKYYGEHRIVIFSIKIDGWWMNQDVVTSIANELGLDAVPVIGIMTTEEMIEYVKSEPKSIYQSDVDFVMEGVVATSYPMMMFRTNSDDENKPKPIMTKLKVSDFRRYNAKMKVRNNES